jgi:hypothetical protein
MPQKSGILRNHNSTPTEFVPFTTYFQNRSAFYFFCSKKLLQNLPFVVATTTKKTLTTSDKKFKYAKNNVYMCVIVLLARSVTTRENKKMARKNKQTTILTNGETIATTEDGWNPAELAEVPVLLAGWQPGKASHHPIALGIALAAKESIPEAYLGDFVAQKPSGEEVLVPVVDPKLLSQLAQEALIEKYNMDVSTVRIATSRTGAKKQYDALKATIGSSPEVMEMIKKTNPALYAMLQ